MTVHCGEPAEGLDLPEIVASSKYIDYSTTRGGPELDGLCLDDMLARQDRFIEEVAAYLGIDPPSGRIRHIQVETVNPIDMACEKNTACYQYIEAEDLGLIRARSSVHEHEIVHAVEIATLGRGHSTLIEGLADFFSHSEVRVTDLSEFPARFKAMVARSPLPNDYDLAMQFVGSLLQSHGVEPYKRFRAALPRDAGLKKFAAVFATVYGMDLDTALAAMSVTPVRGVRLPLGCHERDGLEHISWTNDDVAEATLRAACGDVSFIGSGFDGAYPGFSKSYTMDLPDAGHYRVALVGPGGEELGFSLRGCPDNEGFTGYSAGPAGTIAYDVWRPGRHVLSVGFPEAADLKGEAQLRVEFFGAEFPP